MNEIQFSYAQAVNEMKCEFLPPLARLFDLEDDFMDTEDALP